MSQTELAVRRGEVHSRRGGSMQDEGQDVPALHGEAYCLPGGPGLKRGKGRNDVGMRERVGGR